MTSLTERAARDARRILRNLNEHASLHSINNKVVPVVMLSDTLQKRNVALASTGMHEGNVMFQVLAEDLGFAPKAERGIEFDKKPMTVLKADEEAGVWVITLRQNRM